MTQIQAIETVYKNYRMRSRLEARWAVFFDAMDEEWQYEPEGYDLNGIYYLPDFYLPRLKCFIEIKGQQPTKEELNKCSLFRDYVGKAIAIFHGLPSENQGMWFCWDQSESAGSSEWEVELCETGTDTMTFCVEDNGNRQFYMSEFSDDFDPMLNYPYRDYKFMLALNAAKQARFEHGEQGW